MKQFLQRILQEIIFFLNIWMLGSSLSHRLSDPAYYIEDCRILRLIRSLEYLFNPLISNNPGYVHSTEITLAHFFVSG